MTETTNSSEHNAVYKPSHYEKDGYPSTQVMVRAMFAGTEGKLPLSVYPWWKDAFKYLFRWPLKNGVEDLHKAKRCIDMILEELEANEFHEKALNMTDEEANYYSAYAAIHGNAVHEK